jgi:RimK family alpha-L-glutamate ligase
MKKIGVFYGGKLNSKVEALKLAAEREGIELDLINFKEVGFKIEGERVTVSLGEKRKLGDYKVIFFRTAKNHWEKIAVIVDAIEKETVVIDPIVKGGRPTDICKVHQIKELAKNGLRVPKTVMGDLRWLRENASKLFNYPMILKGSRGDRRSQVIKLYEDKDWEKRWEEYVGKVKNEGQIYMLQEYLENTEDFRVMVVGDKVLGVMKRAVGDNERLKNVFTRVELPQKDLDLAVEAARACGIKIAGVDMVYEKGNEVPLFWEVNKTPNYSRFQEVTGIDVPREIVRHLASYL